MANSTVSPRNDVTWLQISVKDDNCLKVVEMISNAYYSVNVTG